MSDLRDGSLALGRVAAALALRLPAPLGVFARRRSCSAAYDPYRWESCGENPVRLLQEAPPVALARAAEDCGLVERADEVAREIGRVRQQGTDVRGIDPARPVASLCAEYGVHCSLPIYAGGLGILAGDIVKEASDCGLPFVAVGLLYGQGSFHQRLDPSGWQHEYRAEVDPARLPAALVTNGDGLPQKISGTIPRSRRRGADLARAGGTGAAAAARYALSGERPHGSLADFEALRRGPHAAARAVSAARC